MIDGNEPAYPKYGRTEKGLTIRQHFSAMAMQGRILASTSTYGFYLNTSDDAELVAKDSVAFADALIAELNKEVKP